LLASFQILKFNFYFSSHSNPQIFFISGLKWKVEKKLCKLYSQLFFACLVMISSFSAMLTDFSPKVGQSWLGFSVLFQA